MSVERREQLVNSLIETQPRLATFLQPLSSDLIAGSWDLLAFGFQRAFETLWDHAHAETSGVLLRPLLSLWRQSVELALKAAILEVGGSGNRHKLGHNLQGLLEQLLNDRAALGHSDDDDLAHEVFSMIEIVQSFDPFADRFRYPNGADGKPFQGLSVDLDDLFQAHWIIVTWCEGAAAEVRESRRNCDAAGSTSI